MAFLRMECVQPSIFVNFPPGSIYFYLVAWLGEQQVSPNLGLVPRGRDGNILICSHSFEVYDLERMYVDVHIQ